MTSKILELSQNNADVVLKNGEYTISLPYSKDLIMTEGDTLTMKNIFIDTESQSNQKINVPKDITVKMEFGFYYNYTRQDDLAIVGSGGASLPTIDGKDWAVCYDTHRLNPSDMDELFEIHVQGNYNNPVEGGWVDVKYKDEAGAEQTTRVTIPASSSRQEPSSHALCSIYFKNTFTPVLTPEKGLTGALTTKTKTTTGNNPHLTPVLRQFQLTIKKGSYTPQQIVIEFNRQVQKAVLGGELNAIYSNDFLIDQAKITGVGSIYLCKGDGTMAMKLTNANTLLFGASFVELEFQSDTNQFSFQYLHTPYYTDPTQTVPSQPSVGFLNLTPATPGANYISVNKNSGVFFKTLSSEYADGTNATFWTNILGFNLDTLIPPIQSVAVNPINTQPCVLMKFNTPLEDGVNITGGFFPLSAQVNLTFLPTGNKWYKAENMTTAANFLSTTSDTFNILGGQSTISNTQYNSGFFLVGINANFNTSFYSKNNQDNIMAIVSRFYSLNSFTSGTQEDSLIYTHHGAPLTLTSFQVRIMNDKKTIAENLGENSVVFLQLTPAAAAGK